jgi:hypothetical protein
MGLGPACVCVIQNNKSATCLIQQRCQAFSPVTLCQISFSALPFAAAGDVFLFFIFYLKGIFLVFFSLLDGGKPDWTYLH